MVPQEPLGVPLADFFGVALAGHVLDRGEELPVLRPVSLGRLCYKRGSEFLDERSLGGVQVVPAAG